MNRDLLTRSVARLFRLHQFLFTEIPYRLSRDKSWAMQPTQLFITPTLRCNLRCEFCFEIDDINSKVYDDQELSLDAWKAIIDRVPKKTLLTFLGGELFMRRDAMEMFEHAAKEHRFTICTNGTMISPEVTERLLDLVPGLPWRPGLYDVGFSIQGTEPVHDEIVKVKGSYQRTVQAMERFAAERKKQGNRILPFLTMRTTMQPKNIDCLRHVYSLADQFGIDTFNLQVMQDTHTVRNGWDYFARDADLSSFEGQMDIDQLEEILYDLTGRRNGPMVSLTPADIPIPEIIKFYRRESDVKDYRCMLPWLMYISHPDGSLMPCTQASLPGVNLKEMTLKQANKSELFQKFRKMIGKGVPNVCLGCCGCRYIGPKYPPRRKQLAQRKQKTPLSAPLPTP